MNTIASIWSARKDFLADGISNTRKVSEGDIIIHGGKGISNDTTESEVYSGLVGHTNCFGLKENNKKTAAPFAANILGDYAPIMFMERHRPENYFVFHATYW